MTRFGPDSRAGLRVLALVLAAALAGGGCGGDEPAPAGAKGGASKRSGPVSEAAKKQRADLEKNMGILGNALANSPLDVERTQGDCDKYAREAKEAGWNDLVQKLENMKKDARDAFEAAAAKEIKEACETARKYIAARDLQKAKNRVNGLHKNLAKDERFSGQADVVRREIATAERAERYYTRVTSAKVNEAKGRDQWERAQGLLEAFLAIPAFKVSPRAKDVEAALGEVKPKADAVRAARASEKAVPLVPCFKGANDDLFKWDGEKDQVSVKDGVGIFELGDDYGEQHGSIRFGDETWEDYVVDFQIRVERGWARLEVHGTLLEDGGMEFGLAYKVEPPETKDKDKFYKFRVEVHGKDVKISPPGGGSFTKTIKFDKGPFAIRINRGGRTAIKSVWVKLGKPAPAK